MSIEERVAALEQGLAAIQQELLLQRTEAGSGSRAMTVLNRVIAAQELSYRELDENQTILTGVAKSQGKDIKTLKEDVASLKQDVAGIELHLHQHDQRFDRIESALAQILARLPEKPQS